MHTPTLIRRVAALLTLAAGFALAAGGAAAIEEGLSLASARPPLPAKPAGEPYAAPPDGPRVQGDTVADPFVIPAVPFSASGTTCGFVNDYDAVCPYSGSTAPDVVFRYEPATNLSLVIDLCGSTYDSKVYVFENSVANVIACNDDYCEWQSYIHNVPVTAGNTYYIVVDGYGSSCGNYYLDVAEWSSSCVLECPPGTMPEGEPDCYDGYLDSYNGGCGATPEPIFQVLEPACDPIGICGRTGVYMVDWITFRDTDWYELDLTEPAVICLAGDSEVPTLFLIADGRFGCASTEIVAYGECGPCIPVSDICHACETGTWWAWAGPSSWDLNFHCGLTYWLEISGYTGGASPACETTWGRVKELFR